MMTVTRHAIEQYLARFSPKGGPAQAVRKIEAIAEKAEICRVMEEGKIIDLKFQA